MQSAHTVSLLVDDHTSLLATRDAHVVLVFSGARWTDTVAIAVADLTLLYRTDIRCKAEAMTLEALPRYPSLIDCEGVITFLAVNNRVSAVPREALADHGSHRARVQDLAVRVHRARPDFHARVDALSVEAGGLGWALVVCLALLCH